ncbi:MAG: ThiF family adenylyltransferase, partial [Polyangiaceae bacterium]
MTGAASTSGSAAVPSRAPVLLVGAGGIGAPAALALGGAGVLAIDVADDDRVELANLHRQVLFDDADVGRPKLEAMAAALAARFPALRVGQLSTRVHPGNALELVRGRRVVVDACDNFPTRFLLADACAIAGVPVVHAAAIRWQATVLAVEAGGRPCYRCLFEDLPGDAPDCGTAGVLGPVCGVAGAIAADRALRLAAGDASVAGQVVTFDGHRDRLRSVAVRARAGCAL